ncbi:uncharacterized protein C8A04DRAFT_33316 [Dichotomopilus funicola]|uniref:Uncharacterized protein n=1 Tax=Dichotomopilus funicola TaxID=1934379 RepID=A0AAN6ZIV9_9PEZI|nr:hypothetical protein C8A04DRAFT_33316 [Dichotomopilus funicola]
MKFSTTVFTILSAALASATPVTVTERQEEGICSFDAVRATPICCSVTFADYSSGTYCRPPSRDPTDVEDFRDICYEYGQFAMCCERTDLAASSNCVKPLLDGETPPGSGTEE